MASMAALFMFSCSTTPMWSPHFHSCSKEDAGCCCCCCCCPDDGFSAPACCPSAGVVPLAFVVFVVASAMMLVVVPFEPDARRAPLKLSTVRSWPFDGVSLGQMETEGLVGLDGPSDSGARVLPALLAPPLLVSPPAAFGARLVMLA